MSLDLEALRRLVDDVGASAIRETLSPVRENERQRQRIAAKDAAKLRSPVGETEDLEEAEDAETDDGEKRKVVSKKIATGKSEPTAPKALVPDPAEIKNVTFSQIVNMMNMMRSGRSAKDPDTKQKLKDYFEGLNPGERQSLFVFLSGLTQILAGGVEGDEAPDPAEVGIMIKPKQAKEDRPSRPDDSKERKVSQKGEPPPIVVGERADRTDVLRLLRDLRRNR